MSMEIPTLGRLVGVNVRRLRKEQGATLEDLGRAVRGLGFNWSVSRVNAIERGARDPKIGTLATLAVALSCTVRDLVQPIDANGYCDIGDVLVRQSELAALFGSITPTLEPHPDRRMSDNEWLADQGWSPDALPDNAPPVTQLRALIGRSGVVEERTAKALGLDAVELAIWSWTLWGCTLGERRDGLARAQHERAEITAQLRAELAEAVAK